MSRISANLILANEGWAAELHMGTNSMEFRRCFEVSVGLACKIQSSLPSGRETCAQLDARPEGNPTGKKKVAFSKSENISFALLPRKRAACKSVNGSHKYKGNSKDVKPPDLWIHHERLELKPIDKSPDPNPIMTDTPIPRNSQDITPVDNSMDSNTHQRRNSYRGGSP